MRKFSGYEEVKDNNFKEYVKQGGHMCKILKAYTKEFTSKTTGKSFENLYIEYDFIEPDEQAGFFKRKFSEDARADAKTATWKGIYKITVPSDDGSEADATAKKIFKTFITCVEHSNPGYDWIKADWDEKTLVGKIFGGSFGIEEFETMTGEVAYTTKLRFPKSIKNIQDEWDKIEKGEEVKKLNVKLVDKTFMDYEEWRAKRKAEREGTSVNDIVNNITPVNDSDDLPF